MENLGGAEAAPQPTRTPSATVGATATTAPKAGPSLRVDTKLDKLPSEAVETAADGDHRAHLGEVGSNPSRLASDFDTRTWGYAKLKDPMVAHPSFNLESRKTGDGKAPNAFVRRVPRKWC